MSLFPLPGRHVWQVFLECIFPWRRRKAPVRRLTFARPLLELLEERLAPADFTVPGDAKTLADVLILVANSTDNDNTILLGAGTFKSVNQQINVPAGKALTIIGMGAAKTILSAGGQGRVLEFNGGTSQISGENGTLYLCDLAITGGSLKGTPAARICAAAAC